MDSILSIRRNSIGRAPKTVHNCQLVSLEWRATYREITAIRRHILLLYLLGDLFERLLFFVFAPDPGYFPAHYMLNNIIEFSFIFLALCVYCTNETQIMISSMISESHGREHLAFIAFTKFRSFPSTYSQFIHINRFYCLAWLTNRSVEKMSIGSNTKSAMHTIGRNII